MEDLRGYESSQHSIPSPDGSLIASVFRDQLILRSSSDGQTYHTFPLPSEDRLPYRFLHWSSHDFRSGSRATTRSVEVKKPLRILLGNDELVRVYEVDNEQWTAVIQGVSNNFGKIANVIFGADENEILVFSDFGVKVTIWSLGTSRGVEVRDPKSGWSYDIRPRTGHLAILTRAGADDTLMLLSPGTHQMSKITKLQTVDAQGVRWSPDGRWIAVWDVASCGYNVMVYTADGHLFKTYDGGQTSDKISLGVRSLVWHPQSEFLAVGDFEDGVTLLGKSTFSPLARFAHTPSIESLQTVVWEEHIDNKGARSYAPAAQPSHPPPSSSFAGIKVPKTGISLIVFNGDGTLFATRSDSMPSTIWIWSQDSRTAVACLIHHSPVRSVHWHPTIYDMVLLHCAVDQSIIYVWKVSSSRPRVLPIHLDRTGGRLEAYWVFSAAHESPRLMLGNAHNYTTLSLSADGAILPEKESGGTLYYEPDDRFDEGNSMDLSPIKLSQEGMTTKFPDVSPGSSGRWGGSDDLDDTFSYRRR